jgi:hypothetical protein
MKREESVPQNEPSSTETVEKPSDDALEAEILRELQDGDDEETDTLTVLLAIIQSAVMDESFGSSTVRYHLETLGRSDLWDQAVAIAKDDSLDDDEDDIPNDPDFDTV